ncbi:hypothetical protein GY31_01410 [Lysinibacillus sphaericus]|uniref:DUF4083 domain-containing protein n=1 Tax=Lysinibacillus sphaericus TaxID=1421 RepID=A0A2S5D113_LYSSH|nr:hypothetical protein [Lysinibacillus sphaericus]OEC03624.1 hypothetical protein GY31_01410 [Lysinibacillus sphaericus]POZ56741.1 hypothetical protein LYSIN_01524 [Lysinibacillus sphaericus]
MQLYIGDIISTIFILLIFIAMFFVMIKMIKNVKSTAVLPSRDKLQQQVDELTTRVQDLEKH